jgi:myo-inositol-1(or 4)-monophosphatase
MGALFLVSARVGDVLEARLGTLVSATPASDVMKKPHSVPPDLRALAHELADLSGRAILPHFRRQIGVDNKDAAGGFDPVTRADRAAERVIGRALRARQPDHALVGEEFGSRAGASPYTWVIDPIDGTRAFIMGLPLWGTLIGLKHGVDAVLGLMDQPYTRERFWSGARGSRMRTVDGRQRALRTRPLARIADATLTTTHPDMFKTGREQEAFARVRREARMTRFGGDCYAYCLLAAGHIDIVIEAGLKPVDIVALIPIVEQAGGRLTSWTGDSAVDGGRVVACGDPRVHEAVLRLLV